ncbi:MAG: hypothetical protein JXA28_04810 [Bacteroidetes bacterium]|nr:hypothetical protein [Bacteroidota bacterium]
MKQFRQGDILIAAIPEIPPEAEEEQIENGGFVLARGEATGHAHVIRQSRDIAAFRTRDSRYLRALREVTVTHEEHDPISLPAGLYAIIRQREYAPGKIHNVQD